jgi:hypothetical protein
LCACVLVCLCACVLVCLCACVLVCLCACVLVLMREKIEIFTETAPVKSVVMLTVSVAAVEEEPDAEKPEKKPEAKKKEGGFWFSKK